MRTAADAAQMAQMDRRWIAEYGFTEAMLIERAANSCAQVIYERFDKDTNIAVLCGKGNNGNDGRALARILNAEGWNAVAYAVDSQAAGAIQSAGLVVDAMFGTGLCRDITGIYREVIEQVNALPVCVLSVDIPSGVDATTGNIRGIAVRADITVTFQLEKTGMLLYPGRKCCDETIVRKLSDKTPHTDGALYHVVEEADVRRMLPNREPDAHKGTNGRALLCVGSETYTGAALLSSAAALRCGAGIVYAAVPRSVKPAFSRLPEAICLPLGNGGAWDDAASTDAITHIKGMRAIGAGCGCGNIENDAFLAAIIKSGIPTVLDADALNRLSINRALLEHLHTNVVLTPHPGEMARLAGCSIEEIQSDPVASARNMSRKLGCNVLLKGATSCITDGKDVFFCCGAEAGLAKGGSGDVLTGIVTALLAQGLSPVEAACAGSYLLGASAKEAYSMLNQRMLLARDIIAALETMDLGD